MDVACFIFILFFFCTRCVLAVNDFSRLLFKELSLFGPDFFWFQNTPTLLVLSRNKTEGQFSKNTFLTSTKTLPTKQDHFPVSF